MAIVKQLYRIFFSSVLALLEWKKHHEPGTRLVLSNNSLRLFALLDFKYL